VDTLLRYGDTREEELIVNSDLLKYKGEQGSGVQKGDLGGDRGK